MTQSDGAVVEVRDLHGRSYRVGERPHDIMARSRTWMLWLRWAAMAGISVPQYGCDVAAIALQQKNGPDATKPMRYAQSPSSKPSAPS